MFLGGYWYGYVYTAASSFSRFPDLFASSWALPIALLPFMSVLEGKTHDARTQDKQEHENEKMVRRVASISFAMATRKTH